MSSCSLSGPLLYRSPVVAFFDRRHPCFRNFNSVRADKLSAIVSKILNKKEAFISGRFLRLCSSSLIVLFDDIHFSRIFLKVKRMKTAQMFFEDCVAPS